MKPLEFEDKDREKNENAKFLYFDLETYVGPDGVLIPDLAVRCFSSNFAGVGTKRKLLFVCFVSFFLRLCKMTLVRPGLFHRTTSHLDKM